MEPFWTGLVALIVGLFGGGGLLKLLQWLFLSHDKEDWRKERREFIKRLEKKIDHLEAKLQERGEETMALLAENLRLKVEKESRNP